MKIALLTYSTKPRGSVVHTWELANALHHLGHTVCVYALDKGAASSPQHEEVDEIASPPHRQLACPMRLIPARPAPDDIDGLIQQRIQEFVAALQQESDRYDVYHAQDCIGANALVQLKERGQVHHVVRTVHHVEDYESIYLQQCQDKSIRLPDLCLCVSDRWQQALRTDYNIDAPRVVNGVDQQRFSPALDGSETALKTAYQLTGHPIYLTVGGIEPRKNSIRLLEAFAQVQAQQPQAQLIIAGGATLFDYQPYREQFFQRAAALGIMDALVLPGVIPDADLPGMYRCADVFCFPSIKEGWGLVVLEAIAAGLPVVTANETPFTEFLTSEQAILVNPGSVEQIAQGMLAASEPKRSHALVEQSRGILARYTWEKSAQMHLQAYQSLVHSH
ncbi:MSMEG_0565 family glycosyltransferase [Leptolyngbya iicbica]|uniref:MSMEG_0565 family glycosyltransferase n=3 Tax=Cyanophyceae TaxID=3028117 RepID=A0A4Q7EBL5_9CYAN|nr:MSMEG_0565 family glycosyltransferase [Leptolyngbya sp. LK]